MAANSIIDGFEKWKSANTYLWYDDPRRFIQGFVNTEDNLMGEDYQAVELIWTSATSEEREQAKTHFKALLEIIPAREAGELVYVLAFLGDVTDESYLTLLGPTYFPDEESCSNFFSQVRELAGETRALKVNVLEEVSLPIAGDLNRYGHKAEATEMIKGLHWQLVEKAKSLGAILVEPEYTLNGFQPHITHSAECELRPNSTLELGRLAFSVHPGAKLNVPYSEVKGNFRLRD